MKNSFIWCDLSTFDIRAAKKFYHTLFEWEYYEADDKSMNETYHVTHRGENAVAALFVMPKNLQKLKLPSFWMSYIHVENVEKTVRKAKKHKGVIVEIEPTHFDEKSKIALIRDPSGAGFTIYEGKDLHGRRKSGHGNMVWNVHHVSDLKLIKSFYEDVFEWKISSKEKNVYDVVNSNNECIANIEVLGEDVRGRYQYWMPIFEVDNLDDFIKQAKKQGGSLLQMLENGQAMIADPQGGSFLARESEVKLPNEGKSKKMAFSKWRSVVALIIVVLALFLNLAELVFGLIFLLWSIKGIKAGHIYLVEDVTKTGNPLLFWSISGMYVILSTLSILFFSY